jgi:ribosome-associated protein
VSNEERARRYLDRHGLGRHRILDDPRSDPPRLGTASDEFWPSRHLPRVAGNVPAPAEIAALLQDEGGGLDVVVIDVAAKASFTNSLILCTGRSAAHISALADRLVHDLRKRGITVDGDAVGVAGGTSDDWAVVDAGVVVTHVLSHEIRAKYNFESLWMSDFHDDCETAHDEKYSDADGRPEVSP